MGICDNGHLCIDHSGRGEEAAESGDSEPSHQDAAQTMGIFDRSLSEPSTGFSPTCLGLFLRFA